MAGGVILARCSKSNTRGQFLDNRKSVPPFAALKAFEAFGRLGGIRKAAQALAVDHAVVSRHLRALEAWVATPLIDRSSNASWLTADGAAYHAKISAALADIAMATESLFKRDEQQLQIWCVPGFAYHWLNKRLKDFRRQHPEIDLELRPTDHNPDFASNEADGDIRFIRADAPLRLPKTIRFMEVARPELYPVASPSCAAELEGRLQTITDLANAPLLHEEDQEEWRMWLAGQGVEVSGRLPGPRLWHAHLALDAARDGQGIALTNDYLASDDLAAGRLVKIRPALDELKSLDGGAYTFLAREDRWTSPAIVSFRHWLRKVLSQ